MIGKIGNVCLILVIIGFLLAIVAGVVGCVDNLLAPYGGWIAAPLNIKVGVFGVVTMVLGCIGVACCLIVEQRTARGQG